MRSMPPQISVSSETRCRLCRAPRPAAFATSLSLARATAHARWESVERGIRMTAGGTGTSIDNLCVWWLEAYALVGSVRADALLVACPAGYEETVAKLLELRADPFVVNHIGLTALLNAEGNWAGPVSACACKTRNSWRGAEGWSEGAVRRSIHTYIHTCPEGAVRRSIHTYIHTYMPPELFAPSHSCPRFCTLTLRTPRAAHRPRLAKAPRGTGSVGRGAQGQ